MDLEIVNDPEDGIVAVDRDTGDRVPVPMDELDVKSTYSESGEFDSLNTGDLLSERGRVLQTNGDPYKEFEWAGVAVNGFEDLTNWTEINGSLAVETSDVYRGSQSANLTASSGDCRIRFDFSSRQDFSDQWFSAAFKINTVEDGGSPSDLVVNLRIIHDDSSNGWQERKLQTELNTNRDGEWIRSDFGFSMEDSGYDATAIDTIEIASNTRDTIDILVDDIRVHDNPQDTGYVIVSFDDVYDDDLTAAQTFGEYGIPLCLAVTPDYLGDAGHLTESQLDTLYADHDVEMLVHGYEHLKLSTDGVDAVVDDFLRAKKWHHEMGYGQGLDYAIYTGTGDEYSPELASRLSTFFNMAYGDAGDPRRGVQPVKFSSPFRKNRVAFDGGISDAQSAIDYAESHNLVAHIYAHSNNVSESDMDSLASYIDTADVVPIRLSEYHKQAAVL